ncbi:MAG TPA: trypsin-like peptidase domain-containing protein [Bryobacteraceae bacterium]|nr:trypsin-like peptidase domain-containing protein [Bryobacteraceae bacterium]
MNRQMIYGTPALSAELAKVLEGLRMSTVQVHTGDGGGTGVIWRTEGVVITNAHVARQDKADVELLDGRRLRGLVMRRDSFRDLAVLHVKAPNLPAAVTGDSRALRAGELVLAVGNPLGAKQAVSAGVVHAVGPIKGLGAARWVQSDLYLQPGNSGGPLADVRGRVIGINSMIAHGLALSAPAEEVEEFVVRPAGGAWLGITTRPVLVRLLQRTALGLTIVEIESGSAAQQAGFRVGDTLIAADGQPFETPVDLPQRLSHAVAGSVISIDLFRSGRRLTIAATLGSQAHRRQAA